MVEAAQSRLVEFGLRPLARVVVAQAAHDGDDAAARVEGHFDNARLGLGGGRNGLVDGREYAVAHLRNRRRRGGGRRALQARDDLPRNPGDQLFPVPRHDLSTITPCMFAGAA